MFGPERWWSPDWHSFIYIREDTIRRRRAWRRLVLLTVLVAGVCLAVTSMTPSHLQ